MSQHLRDDRDVLGSDRSRNRSQRRALGAYFSPQAVVKYVVKTSFDCWFANNLVHWNAAGYPELKVLDPAAGDGRFLIAASDYLVRKSQETNKFGALCENDVRAAIIRNCLIAIEKDRSFADELRARLGTGSEVHCAEALLSGCIEDGSVDLVLGNPPYLQSKHVEAPLREELRGLYVASSRGEWDICAVFVEQGLRWLRPKGELALVLPSRWWSTQWAAPLRDFLGAKKSVWALVDFGSTQLFKGATVYSSLCFASKRSSSIVSLAKERDGWKCTQVSPENLVGEESWPQLFVGNSSRLQQLISAKQKLGDIARISKGTGTSADSVFVIDPDKALTMEQTLLRPLLRGRDIEAYGLCPLWPKLLVPYSRAGRLIDAREMQQRFPLAFAYLQSKRGLLEARENGRFVGETFYRYGRPQNLAFLGDSAPKLVFPDVAKAGRALLDKETSMVLDSAYSMRVHPGSEYSLEMLCGIMNSRFVSIWLRNSGIPLRGGYVRMKTSQLRDMPLPEAGDALVSIANLVRQDASPDRIDEQARIAYGYTKEEWSSSDS